MSCLRDEQIRHCNGAELLYLSVLTQVKVLPGDIRRLLSKDSYGRILSLNILWVTCLIWAGHKHLALRQRGTNMYFENKSWVFRHFHTKTNPAQNTKKEEGIKYEQVDRRYNT